MSFSNGINAPKENYGKGRKMISVMDILDEQPIKYETIRNSVEVDRRIELKNKVEYGDLVFVRSSEVSEEVGWAKAYLEKEYALYSGFSIRGKKIKEFNPHFVELSLNSVNRKQIERKAGGSTRFNVSQNVMNSLEVLMPKFEEQNKIDRLFKQLDDTIALHQRKIEQLNTLKKGYLQHLFPRNDEKMPRVRFANFEGGWEERKLKEVLKERNSQQHQNANYPLVSFTVENGVTPKTERYNREQLVVGSKDQKKYKITELDDIVYNPANLKFGAIARNSFGKAVFSPIYVTFEVNKNLARPSYVERFIVRPDFIRYSLKYQQGTVYERQSVSPTDLLSLNISVPSEDEQIRISDIFMHIDNTIILYQKKLENLIAIKKSYLQKMFI